MCLRFIEVVKPMYNSGAGIQHSRPGVGTKSYIFTNTDQN
jgi:hypothetical protein